jgi:hypothetical protein
MVFLKAFWANQTVCYPATSKSANRASPRILETEGHLAGIEGSGAAKGFGGSS